MESKGERKGGGSFAAICKLHFSAWEYEDNRAKQSDCVASKRWRECEVESWQTEDGLKEDR